MDPAGDLGFTAWPSGVVGHFHGRLVICGSARCLWDDLNRLGSEFKADFMAIKQAGMYLPFPFDHWAGCHAERMQWMVPLRRDGYRMIGLDGGKVGIKPSKTGIMTHGDQSWPLVDCVWKGPLTGTSSLFGTRVGLALGYDEIVLCGVPLDTSGRFYGAPWDEGVDLNMIDMKEWEKYLPILSGRVKSMSGRTRELLGGV